MPLCTEEWAPGHLVLRSLGCVESNGRCTTFTPERPQTDEKNEAIEAFGKEMAEERKSTRLCDGALFQCPEYFG